MNKRRILKFAVVVAAVASALGLTSLDALAPAATAVPRAASITLTTKTATAIPAMALSAPLPAAAATSHRICETNGHFCLGVSNFNIGTAVSEVRPGRLFIEVRVRGTFQGLPIYRLAFARFPRKCAGIIGTFHNNFVAIESCSGGAGVIWARNRGHGYDQWINRYATRRFGHEELLSGLNIHNSSFAVRPGGTRGWFQKFSNR